MNKIIRLKCSNQYRSFYCSAVFNKRRGRHGPTSDVVLEELIVDKPPSHFPNIKQKLDRINYFDKPINTKNIGFKIGDENYKNFIKFSKNIVLNLEKNDFENDGSLSFEENIEMLSKEKYNEFSMYHQFSQDYIDSTISLAHYYAIFRDLFYHEPFRNENYRELIEANAKNIVNFEKLKNKELFYFTPLVPINIEFIKAESNEEYKCLRSFRGNLIPSQYGREIPFVNINSFGANEQTISYNHQITINCNKQYDPNFYTLALVNLDSHFSDVGVCHWLVSNIYYDSTNAVTNYDTIIKYLPIYGIHGLGYHRYVFVLFQHEKKLSNLELINDYDLCRRKFNGLTLISDCFSKNQVQLVPVGLSWFQTAWDDYCKEVFHNILDMRCPTYEYVYPLQKSNFKQLQFPGRAPFNLYLDKFRDPKELSKEVLLERLKLIDLQESYQTEKMFPTFEGLPRLPHIHKLPTGMPSWLKSTFRRKMAQIGRFRGLRASSAILPLNNNADLDNPRWPRATSDVIPLNVPNPYPEGKRRPKPLGSFWKKPLPEHYSIQVEYSDNLEEKDQAKFNETPK